MKHRISLIAAVTVVIAAFLFWWLSPTQVLKRRTEKLLSVLTFDEGRNLVSSQMSGYSLNALVAKELTLETPTVAEANGTFDRDQIETGFAWLGTQSKFTKFKVREFQSVSVNGDQATVEAKIDGTVVLAEYRPVDGLYNVTLHWQREEDGWRLTKAKWVEGK
jgi:hypothetical protein